MNIIFCTKKAKPTAHNRSVTASPPVGGSVTAGTLCNIGAKFIGKFKQKK
jgi:hypothetical protein